MELSVVITTYNRRDVLEGLLDCLDNQTDNNFETIVVMDNCTDETEELLKERGVKYFDTKIDGYGLATARNMGIKNAKGEAVVILDDDSYPCPEFVEEHKKTARRGVITSGSRRPDTEEDVDNLNGKMDYLLELYGDSTISPLQGFMVENNCCMMKVNWLQVPFNESIKEYGRIGQDFMARLLEKNFMCQFNPRAEIVHLSKHKRKYENRSNGSRSSGGRVS